MKALTISPSQIFNKLAFPEVRFNPVLGRKADFCWFVLPVLIAALLVSGSFASLLCGPVCFFLVHEIMPLFGEFHLSSTWYHYFDKKNRNFFFADFEKLCLYLIIPIAILSATVFAWGAGWSGFMFPIYFVWTIQHLNKQNLGLLLLFHNPGEATVDRSIETRSLNIPAFLMGGCFLIHLFVTDNRYLFALIPSLFICLLSSLYYLYQLKKKSDEGFYINGSALLFWLLASSFFIPTAIIRGGYFECLIAQLFIHFCQYIGLNSTLFGRKYDGEKQSWRLGSATILSITLGIAFVAVLTSIIRSYNVMAPGMEKSILTGFVMGCTLCHYFQDAHVWKFREPFLRNAILPYIKTQAVKRTENA